MISLSETQILTALGAVLLPFFRILGIFSSAPILSNRAMPVRVRVGTSLLLALLVAPLLPGPAFDISRPDALLVLAGEVLIGLALGFIARVILASVEVAGEAVGLQMGLSFAGFFDPSSGQQNPMTRILNWLSLATFVGFNGPVLIVLAVTHSFGVIPPASSLPEWLGRMQPIELGAGMFELGVVIALPFIVMLLFVNLGMGVVSRIAPQLNVFAIGFPITIGAGLSLLVLGLPMLQRPFDLMFERLTAALLN